MKRAERNKAGSKALADAKTALETARALNDELRKALSEARDAHHKATIDAASQRSQREYADKRLKEVSKECDHQARLVRTLVDTLADKYHPIPTNVNVQMAWKQVGEDPAGNKVFSFTDEEGQ